MNCHVFDIYINCFVADFQVKDGYKYNLIEVGPHNTISGPLMSCFLMTTLRALVHSSSHIEHSHNSENLELEAGYLDAYIGTIDENG